MSTTPIASFTAKNNQQSQQEPPWHVPNEQKQHPRITVDRGWWWRGKEEKTQNNATSTDHKTATNKRTS